MDGFKMEGHAEYAEHGADIVCSAVSAISQATLMALKRYSNVHNTVESGLMVVSIVNPNVQTNVLMDMMVNAIRVIAKQHPQNVKLLEEKR